MLHRVLPMRATFPPPRISLRCEMGSARPGPPARKVAGLRPIDGDWRGPEHAKILPRGGHVPAYLPKRPTHSLAALQLFALRRASLGPRAARRPADYSLVTLATARVPLLARLPRLARSLRQVRWKSPHGRIARAGSTGTSI